MTDMSPLDSWLNIETWSSGHPMDQARFNKAILRIIQINNPMPEPEAVMTYIEDKYSGRYEENYLENVTGRFGLQYEAIYEFIQVNKLSI
jgi:hypothetical protein